MDYTRSSPDTVSYGLFRKYNIWTNKTFETLSIISIAACILQAHLA